MCYSHIYRIVMASILVGLLSSCKIGSQFKMVDGAANTVVELADDEPLILTITYIETGSDRAKNEVFWKHVRNVYGSMEQHDGLVGYAIRKELFGKKGWTMSVWKDEDSKTIFVQSKPHREAMKYGLPALTTTKFASVPIEPSQLPPSWREVEDILSEHAAEYHQ